MSPLRQAGRAQLIESHLPLVRAIAKRYQGRGEALDDLVQVGAVALVKASDRFDRSRGVSFAAFAAPAVEGEIRRHLGDVTTSVRIPRELQRMTGKLRACRVQLEASLGRPPTVQELARSLGVEEEDVERGLEAERARQPVAVADDLSADLGADGVLGGSDERLLLEAGLSVLDERERRIVFLRFHADMTEREIAAVVGLSQTHVSRLLAGALERLRGELDSEGSDMTTDEAISRRKADQSLLTAPNPGTDRSTIPVVGAPQKNAEVARYLALPYHVAVRLERENGKSRWSATVEELPGCAGHGATADEAAADLNAAMERWISKALADRREIPEPNPDAGKRRPTATHSGRLLVRMPSELHQELAQAAERERVSLNRFIGDVLAASVGRDRPSADPPESPSPSSDDGDAEGKTPVLRFALITNIVVVVLAGVAAVVLLILALEHGI